ncbi:uncharacterized protein C2845_PM05G02150 [Panicum miliaceum]|uniref:Uncharacterized protein n=1 Tax=Panicum miliaceum TaxID=4540 RepID=A0A3L6T152_PANMI|nr:uncharacterized protein C2845_PM05G02150 [Panicum miliaceum]
MQHRRREGGGPSSGRSGERASSAAPNREGGVERMQHRGSKARDGLPSSGEETSISPKRRRKKERQHSPEVKWMWIPRRLLWKFHGNVQAALKAYAEEEGNASIVWFHVSEQAALKAYAEEEGNAPAALKETEEESIKQNDDATLKKGLVDDAGLMMDQTALRASHNSSWSGDAQEEAPIDREETSLLLKMDKKPRPSSSVDCGKIAQDEDEDGCSDRKPCVLEDEHSDKIGAHTTEDHKQGQGSARGHVQALLDMDHKTIKNKISYLTICLNFHSPERGDYCPEYKEEELFELYEKLALYRIRAYELTVDRKLDKLDDASLKLEYPPSKLRANGFFKHYEKSLEWYFDLERCKDASFDNYQRLVLHGDRGYVDWDFYTSVFVNTYEQDLAFVRYFEAVAKQTKWIENYLGDSTIQWKRIKDVAYMQALEIAAGFPDVSPLLITYCFPEYICSIEYDYDRKGLDDLYFEIWKRVAKGKMSYKEALFEIHKEDMIPLRRVEIKNELENIPNMYPVKKRYDAHVAGIDKMTPDDKAHELIKEAVVKINSSKPKYFFDYAKRKTDIAKAIGLIP